jgi:hypothetical protein
MGQVLGLGITHYPGLSFKGNMCRRIRKCLEDPALPEKFRDPGHWHPTMRAQWGADDGQAHSDRHRHDMIEQFRLVREQLDAFSPDFVLLWGDDQYENFREDCIPPYSLLAYEAFEFQPWKHHSRGPNSWDEPVDKTFSVKGHRAAGKYLASALLKEGIDVAYAYKPRHAQLGHAFANSVLYLDYDRKGFPYPILPFATNAYGRQVISAHGAPMYPSQALAALGPNGENLDPPGPQPWRSFDVGAAIGRALQASPWRVAIVASSSWSHSFLVKKHGLMFPDVESDKRYYQALCEGDWEFWRETSIEEAEDRGHHELLNWFALAGALHALGIRKPRHAVFLESWISNSDKVFAVFPPSEETRRESRSQAPAFASPAA